MDGHRRYRKPAKGYSRTDHKAVTTAMLEEELTDPPEERVEFEPGSIAALLMQGDAPTPTGASTRVATEAPADGGTGGEAARRDGHTGRSDDVRPAGGGRKPAKRPEGLLQRLVAGVRYWWTH